MDFILQVLSNLMNIVIFFAAVAIVILIIAVLLMLCKSIIRNHKNEN